jgi:hypothetical protein
MEVTEADGGLGQERSKMLAEHLGGLSRSRDLSSLAKWAEALIPETVDDHILLDDALWTEFHSGLNHLSDEIAGYLVRREPGKRFTVPYRNAIAEAFSLRVAISAFQLEMLHRAARSDYNARAELLKFDVISAPGVKGLIASQHAVAVLHGALGRFVALAADL